MGPTYVPQTRNARTTLTREDNVDYNEIKYLIKARTTKGQATAISIPGYGNENAALDEFEEQLYDEFCDQHQRINLFVKSKAGEIQRRLSECIRLPKDRMS
jgi:hypothetical protein